MQSATSLEPLLGADPVEAMEAAKAIIGNKLAVDPEALKAIASDRKGRKWSRIAAVYSLGFLGEGSAGPALIRILADSRELIALRAHAAEALGNIGAPRAIPALAGILTDETSPSLRKSSRYALEEIGGPEARTALEAARSPRRQPKPKAR